MTAKHIEYSVASLFGYRQNNIVPNVSWGAGLHECDLLIILKSKWAVEVEIKISKSDMKADLKKKHNHKSIKIGELYYAMPKDIYEQCKDLIPEHAGIITVDEYNRASFARCAKKNPDARKMTDEEISGILRLGNMRTWSMRKKQLQNEGVISKPKRETKADRQLKSMKIELQNIYHFLKRGKYNKPELVDQELAYIESLIENSNL